MDRDSESAIKIRHKEAADSATATDENIKKCMCYSDTGAYDLAASFKTAEELAGQALTALAEAEVDLAASIQAAQELVGQEVAALEEAEAQSKQSQQELAQHKAMRRNHIFDEACKLLIDGCGLSEEEAISQVRSSVAEIAMRSQGEDAEPESEEAD